MVSHEANNYDPGAFAEAALQYAGIGWSVFPCYSAVNGGCSCGKAECHCPGKHPRTANGLHNATSCS